MAIVQADELVYASNANEGKRQDDLLWRSLASERCIAHQKLECQGSTCRVADEDVSFAEVVLLLEQGEGTTDVEDVVGVASIAERFSRGDGRVLREFGVR